MSEDGPALLVIEDDVATIRLNRPSHGNALDLATVHALRDVVVDLQTRPALCAIVLRSEGRMFCAGGDVRAMAASADRRTFVHELADTMHQALVSLRALPVPIIASVQGTTAGAGLGLVLAADIAIASDEARFLSAYGDVGLSPDCGVSALLPAVIGPRRAALFTLTDLVLDAATACEWGLVSEVCPPTELAARIADVIARITKRPSEARGTTASLLRQSQEQQYAEQLDAEADNIARLAATLNSVALIDAFNRSQPGGTR
jgi:2-(1,2-epoxy-1,2-dihydrophenyl)acetyl-CoA isomerase